MARRCPKCKLVNPGSAQRCDCGYSFADGTMGQALQLQRTDELDPTKRSVRQVHDALMYGGLGVMGLGIVVVSIASAQIGAGIALLGFITLSVGRFISRLSS